MTIARTLATALRKLIATGSQAPPVSRGAVTSLKPYVLDTTAPALPAHPDLPLVMEHWRLHQKHFPGHDWPQFIRSLEKRHAFFAEERRERAAKLAQINARPRFRP